MNETSKQPDSESPDFFFKSLASSLEGRGSLESVHLYHPVTFRISVHNLGSLSALARMPGAVDAMSRNTIVNELLEAAVVMVTSHFSEENRSMFSHIRSQAIGELIDPQPTLAKPQKKKATQLRSALGRKGRGDADA